jgi:cyanophycin synthetase
VILDYAHNSAGWRRSARWSAAFAIDTSTASAFSRFRGIAATRTSSAGRIASGIFDELYFSEDPGTRGRPRGEVMKLLEQGAIEGGAAPDRVHLIATEHGATRAALMSAGPGDLVVVTPTDVTDLAADHEFEKIESATN